VVECLPSKPEALNSNTKKNTKPKPNCALFYHTDLEIAHECMILPTVFLPNYNELGQRFVYISFSLLKVLRTERF
jgi:hypothetical protein